jgi:hypothetical protein
MKAMVLLALILLPLAMQADVVIPENEKQNRPAPQDPGKTDTTVTATTTAGTTTASPTSPAPAPERRRSTFPFAALFTIGIILVAALSAKRRRERKAQ